LTPGTCLAILASRTERTPLEGLCHFSAVRCTSASSACGESKVVSDGRRSLKTEERMTTASAGDVIAWHQPSGWARTSTLKNTRASDHGFGCDTACP
jgi:hypothetical protein